MHMASLGALFLLGHFVKRSYSVHFYMCESVGVRAYDLCIKTENCGATTTSRHISFLCSPEKVSVYFIIKKLPNLITAKLCVESSKISILGSANTLGSFFVGCFALLIRRLSLCMNCHCHSFACCVWRKNNLPVFFSLCQVTIQMQTGLSSEMCHWLIAKSNRIDTEENKSAHQTLICIELNISARRNSELRKRYTQRDRWWWDIQQNIRVHSSSISFIQSLFSSSFPDIIAKNSVNIHLHTHTRAPTHICTHVCRWKRWMIFNDYTEIYFFIITKRCLAHITMMNKIEREADRWRLSGSETEWEKWNHLGLNKWWWRDAKKQRRWIHQVNSRNIARSHTDSDTCDTCRTEWEKNTRRNENKMYKNTQR